MTKETAQRLALPGSGRAWTLPGSREKLEATLREMPVKRADSHLSGARIVSLPDPIETHSYSKHQAPEMDH